MRILFQCNTVYQLLVCLQMKMELFTRENADIVVSNIMNDSEKIREKLKASNRFDNVYDQEIKGAKYGKISWLLNPIRKSNYFFRIGGSFDFKKKYDTLFFSNPTPYNYLLFQRLRKANRNIKMFYYEDGLSSYAKLFGKSYFQGYEVHTFGDVIRHNTLKYSKFASGLYCFSTAFFDYTPNKPLFLIPKFDPKDGAMLKLANFVFGISSCPLPPDCKYIFFEEGYFADGKDVNDIDIITTLMTKFGKEGFYVKRHPRNSIDRFSSLGIKILPTNSIPWELIVANNIDRIESIQLFSIASAAIYTPTILFGLKPKCWCCSNMINNKGFLYPTVVEVQKKILLHCPNITYLEQK